MKLHSIGQILFISGLLILSFSACRKDRNGISVKGLYTEISPVAGRSQLNFINSHIVIKSETGSRYQDIFRYSISAGKIQLTPAWSNQYPAQESEFEKLIITPSGLKTFTRVFRGLPKVL
jgi:hypothetical protein